MNFLSKKFSLIYERKKKLFLFHLESPALVVEGEMLWLSKVTRSEMGAYLCIASNAVPPSVSKRIKLQVHCKYTYNFLARLILFTFNFRWIWKKKTKWERKKNLIQISAPPEICIINFRRMIYVDIFFTFDNPKASRFTYSGNLLTGISISISLLLLCIRIRQGKKRDTANNSLGDGGGAGTL